MTHPICNRCYKPDIEGFGGYQVCNITKKNIYTCFECTSICDYCKKNNATLLDSNNKHMCESCYNNY